MSSIPSKEQIKTVGELTFSIKKTLESEFSSLWVKGEISNLRYQSSGHVYFTLKDDRAQISAVMFRGDASKLNFRLKEGMEVVAFGNISVYEPRGSYQIIVRNCIEEGVGQLQAEFERLKQALNKEGLFDPSLKKRIPSFPRKIGIITSPTGAALRDFLSILNRREWQGEIVLFPAVVQGIEGKQSLLNNLDLAEEFGQLDLLVLGRGGGSLEDLWNFNEEEVVRRLSNYPIPTISAVGHEIDFVLTDFVADKRAETPSAAAELISSLYLDMQNRLIQSSKDLNRQTNIKLDQLKQKLDYDQERLKGVAPLRVLENRHLRLDELQERLRSKLKSSIQHSESKVDILRHRIETLHPQEILNQKKETLGNLFFRLNKDVMHQMDFNKQRTLSLEKRIQSLGVDQVLKRGFTMTLDAKGIPLTCGSKLRDGQQISTKFHDEEVKSFVQKRKQLDLF